MAYKVLIVDLNNFSRYPTMAIGYLTATLRKHGLEVDVLSPLNHGVKPFVREKRATQLEHIKNRIYFSGHPLIQHTREFLRTTALSLGNGSASRQIAELTKEQIDSNSYDIVLLSAYLNHRESVELIADYAHKNNLPVLLGGPAFNLSNVSEEWLKIEGITAIYGGEADISVHEVTETVIRGLHNKKALPGLFTRNRINNSAAPPLQGMDQLPFPDYSDFPWKSYDHRLMPIITGRGCAWGACTFCSDVITANGRGFRSHTPEYIGKKLEYLSQQYGVKDFVFLDMKLNSDLTVWRYLIQNFQNHVPGGNWIATVHVDGKIENGLSSEELKAARESGLIRISFGLETGSQRINSAMAKGTTMERNHEFVRNAGAAGISVRASLMLGYPGEQAEDIDMTSEFLRKHSHHLDRVRLSRFKIIPGTRFEEKLKRGRFSEELTNFEWDHSDNRAIYNYKASSGKRYRKAKRTLLDLVHSINSKPFNDSMKQFDGLM